MTVLALHRHSMESTHGGAASTFGPLEAIALVLATVLLMAAIGLGVLMMLNAARGLLTPAYANWPSCLLHY